MEHYFVVVEKKKIFGLVMPKSRMCLSRHNLKTPLKNVINKKNVSDK
jgi:hypothetical protein